MDQTKKRTRPKKTEFEKKLEKAIAIAKKTGVHSIKTPEFEVVITPPPIANQSIQKESIKIKPKVNAAGIEINGLIPKEEIYDENEMLFWSTPSYQMEKELMNGEALEEKANQ